MSDVRNKVYNFRANESVSEIIETKFKLSNCKTKSDFIRSMIFNRMVVKYDETQLRKIFSLMNNITNNLNQISLKARAINSPCVMEIEQLKGEVDEVWQLLKSMQSILLKLKP